MSDDLKIISDSKNPIITMPKRIIPTISNYGTCRFQRGEQIVCKDVAFVVTFISNDSMTLRLLDKRVADELTGKNKITNPRRRYALGKT